jgi:transketolase
MTADAEAERAELIAALQFKALTIRRDILTMIHAAQSGHPGGSLSAADIVTALYFHFMRVDPSNPEWPDRDRFILSKGHACPVWYSCLAERGFFPVQELLTLREIDGRLQGHPDMSKTPGVDITTGSLGQGLSAGVGFALGLKLDQRDAHVYVMLGDGELNEGQVWEAAMAAAKFGLDNLVAIVDYNGLQLDGYCREVMPIEPLADKWQAFNWQVLEIDGHDMSEILNAFERAQAAAGCPTVIIAHTVKGKGVSYMEDKCNWHGKAPNDELFSRAMAELDEVGGEEAVGVDLVPTCKSSLASDAGQVSVEGQAPLAGRQAPQPAVCEDVPTRDAYGEVLVELGEEIPNLVVLEADIAKSTRTCHFAARFPERFFQFGVAEANMMVAAAGLATTGKIPFVSTYAVFGSMRACEQVRTSVAYPKLNVKIAVSHGGVTPANDGVTHQATEDLGIMRTIPGMTVIMPADYYATKALVRASAAHTGPVYLRFTRDPVPIIYGPDEVFEIGRGKVLREGNDVSLIATGDLVSVALAAADQLVGLGVSAEVIDMHTVKPIDRELVVRTAAQTRRVVTIEDHQIQGGLGSAVAEVLGEELPTPMRRVGLRNTFAESGRYDLLLAKYGMDTGAITAAVAELLD